MGTRLAKTLGAMSLIFASVGATAQCEERWLPGLPDGSMDGVVNAMMSFDFDGAGPQCLSHSCTNGNRSATPLSRRLRGIPSFIGWSPAVARLLRRSVPLL